MLEYEAKLGYDVHMSLLAHHDIIDTLDNNSEQRTQIKTSVESVIIQD